MIADRAAARRLIDPETLGQAIREAILSGSGEHPDADLDAAIWGFHLGDVFGATAGRIIGMLQVGIGELQLTVGALEARIADLEIGMDRRAQPLDQRSIGDMIQWIAKRLQLTPSSIRGPAKDIQNVTARQIVTYAARTLRRLSYPAIARAMGGRDHTTIVDQFRRAELRRRADGDFRALSDELVAAFSPPPPAGSEDVPF